MFPDHKKVLKNQNVSIFGVWLTHAFVLLAENAYVSLFNPGSLAHIFKLSSLWNYCKTTWYEKL